MLNILVSSCRCIAIQVTTSDDRTTRQLWHPSTHGTAATQHSHNSELTTTPPLAGVGHWQTGIRRPRVPTPPSLEHDPRKSCPNLPDRPIMSNNCVLVGSGAGLQLRI
jgi:hypothetical protein